MSKRKLSIQQTQRIKKRQSDSRESSGSDQHLGEPEEGLVISRFGNQADIETTTGAIQRCVFRSHMGSPVAGDKVIWRPSTSKSKGVIESVNPRKSELIRPDSFGNIKIVAANIDCMIITMALKPEPHPNLIDRYLVAAANLQLEPVILINKYDLISDETQAVVEQIQTTYQNLNIKVLTLSTKTGYGLDALNQVLENAISVFVGQSGVGKSSILQTLMPNETIKIGELSEQAEKGRHTTTSATLYHFLNGGDCIDSPGIREFGLWHLSAHEIIKGFPDLFEYSQTCKFRDCSHTQEPGCELLAAIEENKVSKIRFDSYQRIVQSLDEVDIKTKL